MNQPAPISQPLLEALLLAVCRRHHRLLATRIAVSAFAAAAAAVVLLAVGGWVVRGESVPLWPFVAVTLAVAAYALVAYGRGRISIERAAVLADAHFNLKDGLTSALFLQRTTDSGISELQWRWLCERIDKCRPESIQRPFPQRTAAIGAVLAVIAIWLGLLPPSPTVIAAREQAIETRNQVAAAKEHLLELIETLEQEMQEANEPPELAMDEFRKMVEEIDPTGDRTEAARQFARIEQKTREAARSIDQRRDMETLRMAASELAKAEETEPRQLARRLENEELKEAAEMLKELAQTQRNPQDFKKQGEHGRREMEQARQELARMRAVTRRMAAAARQRQAEGRAGESGEPGDMTGEDADMMITGDGQGDQLEDLMTAFDQAAADMERLLREIELDPDAELSDEFGGEFGGEFGDEFGDAEGLLADRLSDLQGKLGRMNARAKSASRLQSMMRGIAQARAMTQGEQSQMTIAAMTQSPGGREAGTGTDETRRAGGEDEAAAGGLAQLQGQHGSGPSLSAVEAAESGSGVSGIRGETREREFSRQIESFVERDDIPESLKHGVRNYFENLQSSAPLAADD